MEAALDEAWIERVTKVGEAGEKSRYGGKGPPSELEKGRARGGNRLIISLKRTATTSEANLRRIIPKAVVKGPTPSRALRAPLLSLFVPAVRGT